MQRVHHVEQLQKLLSPAVLALFLYRNAIASSSLEVSSTLFVQEERRLQADRTGRICMIDLTKDVSPTVLAEQNQRGGTEALKLLQEAVKPYKQHLVRFINCEHQVELNIGFGICQASHLPTCLRDS